MLTNEIEEMIPKSIMLQMINDLRNISTSLPLMSEDLWCTLNKYRKL